MRELQSTHSLLNRILSQLRDPKRIRNVTVALGEISELDQDLILHHWLEFSTGTPAEHAHLHFRLIQAEVQCMACFSKYHPNDGKIHCPYCGSYGAKVLAGEEFYLESIEFDED